MSKSISQGNVHGTIVYEDRVEQLLNPAFAVPSKDKTNRLNRFLRKNGIGVALIIEQTKEKRVMERLDGAFYDKLDKAQRKKAMGFLRKLHNVLERYGKRDALNQFYLVSQFRKGDELIWGDTKVSNILWKDNEPVGIVDYDTVSLGSVWYDVFMALATWGNDISYEEMSDLIATYLGVIDVSGIGWEVEFRRFALLKIKEMAINAFGLGYFVPRPLPYYKERIKHLNRLYEESFVWGSI